MSLAATLQSRASFRSQGKVELGPQRYPSLLQLSLYDLMEMRVAGTLPSRLHCPLGRMRVRNKGSRDWFCVRMSVWVCLHVSLSLWLCALPGINTQTQEEEIGIALFSAVCRCIRLNVWGFIVSADAPKWPWMDQSPPTRDMWPIQGCSLLFKKGTKTSIKDLTHLADTNWAQWDTHIHTHTEAERAKRWDWRKGKEKKKRTKSSSPPPCI